MLSMQGPRNTFLSLKFYSVCAQQSEQTYDIYDNDNNHAMHRYDYMYMAV